LVVEVIAMATMNYCDGNLSLFHAVLQNNEGVKAPEKWRVQPCHSAF
jgi:hypothetical protein